MPRNLSVRQIVFLRGWREEAHMTNAEQGHKYKYNLEKREIRDVPQDLKKLVRKGRRLRECRRQLKLKLQPLAKLRARLEEEREALHAEE